MNIRFSINAALAVVVPLVLSACGGGLSRYQGMTADELYELAQAERERGELGDAIQTLDRLMLVAGDWPFQAEARLMLADTHFEKGEYLTARSQYQRFLDRHTGHASSPDAALGICRSLSALAPQPERDQGYTLEAITACRNVVIDYAGLQQARDAGTISNEMRGTMARKEFLNGEYYFRRKLFDSAIIYYEIVAESYSETEWAPWALLGVYRSNEEIGYDDLAEDASERLLGRYPESEAAAQLRSETSGA